MYCVVSMQCIVAMHRYLLIVLEDEAPSPLYTCVFFQQPMFVAFCFRLPIKMFDKTKVHFKNLGN